MAHPPAHDVHLSDFGVDVERLRARFFSHTRRTESGCLEWTGTRLPRGYGRFGIRDKVIWQAHRVALLLEHGTFPGGMLALHSCDNPPCVEVSHLRFGTPSENNADMVARGRVPRVEGRHPTARLFPDQVLDIRRRVARGETFTAAGRAHGVTRQTATDIVRGKLWAHVA